MRRKYRSNHPIILMVCVLAGVCALAFAAYFLAPSLFESFLGRQPKESAAAEMPKTPDGLLVWYMQGIRNGDYEGQYDLLSETSKQTISKEEFVARNQKIYDGIEAANLTAEVTGTEKGENGTVIVHYTSRMDSLAGPISFENSAVFRRGEDKRYRLDWSSALIFPKLSADDKVRVNTQAAKRGCIYDRNGELLAGEGIASSVGFVPGKMRKDAGQATATTLSLPDETPVPTREEDIAHIAELLELPPESIQKKLSASYVKDNTFVALKTVSKEAYDLKGELLKVPGIKIVDTKVRYYPLGEKASHLIGYIQNINAEELAGLSGKGYHANSMIGKAGLEKILEDRLRASDGCLINIVGASGEVKQTLASTQKKDGEDISLTIDSKLQSDLFDQFTGDNTCSVALNPKTGEVLALVSTPTYDANEFVLGMSANRWNALNDDPNKPLWNRFKAALCPGSTFKAITAAVGLSTGILSPDDDFGHSGLRWRADSSWGGYYVTTTKEYEGPANVENALTYSDNIFFAKTALKIGAQTFADQLKAIGFEERIPFEYGLYSSTISDKETFTSDIQLADSGFGQGQILVNPIHLAAVYASFLNDGSILQPTLFYVGEPTPKFWKQNAFSPDSAELVLKGLKEVIRRGTGKEAQIENLSLAGKTGTAEIKLSKDDETGTELGWFVLFTADKQADDPLLVVSMVENVKDRGGSHYVVPKVRKVFQSRFGADTSAD